MLSVTLITLFFPVQSFSHSYLITIRLSPPTLNVSPNLILSWQSCFPLECKKWQQSEPHFHILILLPLHQPMYQHLDCQLSSTQPHRWTIYAPNWSWYFYLCTSALSLTPGHLSSNSPALFFNIIFSQSTGLFPSTYKSCNFSCQVFCISQILHGVLATLREV